MLLDELEADPRVTVAKLAAIYRRHRLRKNFVAELADAVASGAPGLERAGAWCLRRWMAEGGTLPAEAWEVLAGGLQEIRSWEGRLLMCRVLAESPDLWRREVEPLVDFVRRCVGDDVPFVRAWAGTALQTLADLDPAYRAEAGRWVAKAARDPAKSVQARGRKLRSEAERAKSGARKK